MDFKSLTFLWIKSLALTSMMLITLVWPMFFVAEFNLDRKESTHWLLFCYGLWLLALGISYCL